MKYLEETAVIHEVRDGSVVVYVSNPDKHESKTCTGCGACAARPGVVKYTVPVRDTAGLACGQTVQIRRAEVNYWMSLFLLFVLPVLLMALVPLGGIIIGKSTGNEIFSRTWFVALEAFSGLVIAVFISIYIEKRIQKHYPLQFSQ